ncbi:hypothetical protein C0208_03905 [Moraxella catarrhalis]|nr:hypothetical protein [Moraxella catarrhalis]
MMVLIDNYCYNITDNNKVNHQSTVKFINLWTKSIFAVVGLLDTHNRILLIIIDLLPNFKRLLCI